MHGENLKLNEPDHLLTTSFSAKVKNAWSYVSTLSHNLLVWYLFTDRRVFQPFGMWEASL